MRRTLLAIAMCTTVIAHADPPREFREGQILAGTWVEVNPGVPDAPWLRCNVLAANPGSATIDGIGDWVDSYVVRCNAAVPGQTTERSVIANSENLRVMVGEPITFPSWRVVRESPAISEPVFVIEREDLDVPPLAPPEDFPQKY